MRKQQKMLALAVLSSAVLAACGGGGSSSGDANANSSASSSAVSSAVSSSADASSSSAATSSSSSSVDLIVAKGTCPAMSVSGIDAQTLTGDSTPFQSAVYGVRNYEAPVAIGSKHSPSNYKAAPALPTWQFASSDPTEGTLSNLECDVAPDKGWPAYVRASGTSASITHKKVVVTGGRNAAANRIYTVFNGQQLVAAINEAKNEPKIIRVVGHIDLRMESNNTVFKEYTSYRDQKLGGSIMIPSNTTLVGINDKDGKPARITGTTILIGSELGTSTSVLAGATGDAEADFKKWIAAGKDGDLYPTWTRNIILRNLKIDTPWDVNPEDSGNAYADGMTISRAQNVWIDHISMSDGDTPDSLASDTRHDGSLDVVRGSDYVSVTNSLFGDHGKNTLVGNGDSGRAWSDEGRLHVTFSGLWWRGIASRHPLTRFSQLHTYNNLMEGSTTSTALGHKFQGGLDVRYQSSVFSENNFHLFTGLKPREVCGKISGGSQGLGFRVTGAQFISDKTDDGKAWSGGPVDVTGALAAAACTEVPAADIAWTPPYSYSALDANAARAAIEVNTGAGRIGMYAKLGTARDLGATSSTSSSAASSSTSSSSSSSASTTVAAGVTGSWTEEFSADATSFYTATYKALPDSSSTAMYNKTGGTPAFADGVMTLTGSRVTIGARGTASTTASSTPGGVFTINNKSCTLTINTSEAGTGTGKFQVFVDNNTTSGGNSVHGSSSAVVNVATNSVVAGANAWSFAISTANFTGGSFLMLRTESSNTVKIDSASLNCI